MPMFDGIRMRSAPHLGWRNGDPTRDKTLDGRPLERNYVAIVRIKDCEIKEKADGSGRRVYDPSKAPALRLAYGATFKAYGPWRVNNRTRRFGKKLDDALLFPASVRRQ